MKKSLHLESRSKACFKMFLLLTFLSFGLSHAIAQTQFVNGFGGPSNWYADDMRNVSGVNLVGVNSTMHGKPGQTATAADDLAIANQLQFVAGPPNGTYGGAVKIIHPTNDA